jgi:uncharacterized protein (TIGR02453 family)
MQAVFNEETFRFFRQLKRNNHKEWMDKHRERYHGLVTRPFRRLREEVTPAVLEIDENFDVMGKGCFSRINRDIRFAKDKTLYKCQMYLKLHVGDGGSGKREHGELYVGLNCDTVTAGFRIYAGAKRRESKLAMIGAPRAMENPKWVAQQKKRLGKKYESYWYETVKGEWTKREGWPTAAENWKKIGAWIVRRQMTPGAATGESFAKDLPKMWKELYPLLKFTSVP